MDQEGQLKRILLNMPPGSRRETEIGNLVRESSIYATMLLWEFDHLDRWRREVKAFLEHLGDNQRHGIVQKDGKEYTECPECSEKKEGRLHSLDEIEHDDYCVYLKARRLLSDMPFDSAWG